MRKIDKNPTESNLIELLRTDPISRNTDLCDFIEILPSFEHGATVFHNGDWGAGKTFFVKQLKLIIEAMNPMIKSGEGAIEALERIPTFSNLFIADGKLLSAHDSMVS